MSVTIRVFDPAMCCSTGVCGPSVEPDLARFAAERAHDFELPRELRPKNAYNLLRLLATAERWLREGEPVFEMSGALRTRLLAIKAGEVFREPGIGSLDDTTIAQRILEANRAFDRPSPDA